MENTTITFDQLPAFIYQLGRKVDDLTELLRSHSDKSLPAPARHFNVQELCAYLPDRPAVTTVYGLVQRREIPFGRRGKKLIFYQPDIDQWLADKRSKTVTELSAIADKYVNDKKGLVRQKGGRNHV